MNEIAYKRSERLERYIGASDPVYTDLVRVIGEFVLEIEDYGGSGRIRFIEGIDI